MPLKNRILPLFILALLFLIKCKDSPTQSNAPTQVAEQTSVTEVDASGSAPEQLAPSDTAKNVGRNPQFKWQAVDGADAYQLDASTKQEMVLHQRVDGTDFTPDTAWSANTTYYWRIRAIHDGTKGKWSEVHSFTTGNSIRKQLPAPEQAVPSDKGKGVVRNPQFKWQAVDGADAYLLDASTKQEMVLHQRVDGTDFTPDTAWSAKTTYYWRVRAVSEGTKGKWSEVHSFTTSRKKAVSKKVVSTELQSPKDNTEDRPVNTELQWKKVPDASKYKIQLGHGEQVKSLVLDKSVKATSYKLSGLDSNKKYTWRVKPVVGDKPAKWSKVWHFKTVAKSDLSSTGKLAAPEQKAPSDKKKGVARTPKFKWQAVDGADVYLLDVSDKKKLIIHKRVDASSFTPDKALSAKKTYYWRVRAIAGDTDGKWSEVESFTTAAKEGDSTPAVSLGSPNDGASDQPLDLSLRWQSLSGISQYQLQVAPERGFSRPVTDETIGSTTYNLSGLNNNQTYYWRVQAAGDGNSNNWSATRSFRTKAAVQNDGSSSSRANSDRQALMDLYKATDGDRWANNSGWDSSASLDSWYGIKTDSQGRVTSVDLFKNNLKGRLPKSIGRLNKVTYFNVKNNHLTGKIPPEIGKMESLKTLILQGRTYELGGTLKEPSDNWNYAYHQGKRISNTNRLSGTIPSEIGNLSNLVILEIANAPDIKGPIPSTIGNLSKLKGLYLSFDDFSGTTLPSSLGNLRNLKHMYIASSQLTGSIPASFENLTQLYFLNLGESSNSTPDNHLTGKIPDFSNFTSLLSLDLTDNNLTGKYPKYFNNGNFKNLRTLNLTWNNLTGTLGNFDNLQDLQLFDVSGNKMQGSVSTLTNLPARIQLIGIGWNNFSGDFPQNGWADFTQLKTIWMNDNKLTGNIPCSFWKKLDNPKLNIARFQKNKFSGTCKSGAKAMKGDGSIELSL